MLNFSTAAIHFSVKGTLPPVDVERLKVVSVWLCQQKTFTALSGFEVALGLPQATEWGELVAGDLSILL
jgi:hypothetical protein